MHFDSLPEPLVDQRGQVRLGLFPDSVTTVNGRACDYRTPMGSPASRRARHFHYKQFQYLGVISDDLLIGCALADTAYLGVAFLYIYEPATGTLEEHTWRAPLGRGLCMSDSPVNGASRFRRGGTDIALGYRADGGAREKSLTVRGAGLTLDVVLEEPEGYQPMSLCTRTGVNGWVYANKVAGVGLRGRLRWRGREWALADLANVGGHHDFSAGYMRRETFWNWACFSACIDGHRVGLNVSCGVNETSVNENCLWLDGRLIKLDGVSFDYQRDNLMAPWRMRSRCGRLQLRFEPHGEHRERLNLGLFASNFHQLFGVFHGELRLPDGTTLPLSGQPGFVEEQYAKW